MSATVKKSPISVLDEFCKRKLQPPAEYTINSDNTTEFICTVKSFNETKTAKAKSKQKAKHAAAHDLIKHLRSMESFKFDSAFLSDSIINFGDDTEVSSSTTNCNKRKHTTKSTPDINYIGNLFEFCTKNKLPPPSFEFVDNKDCTPTQNQPHEFLIKCWVNDIGRQGKGSNKKLAKKEAAKEVLNELMERQPESKSVTESSEPSPKRLKGKEEPICNEAANTTFSGNDVPVPQVQYKEEDKINPLNYACEGLGYSDDDDSLEHISSGNADNEDFSSTEEIFSPQPESDSVEDFDNDSTQESDYDGF